MKMIKRLGLHVSFMEEFEVIFCQLDKATVKTIDMWKRNNQTSQQWWTANKEWASLILPEEATDKCMEEQKSWRTVEASLTKAVQSCEAGRRLFGRAAVQLDYDRVSVKINQVVGALTGKDLDRQVLAQNRNLFNEEMVKIGIDPLRTSAKRQAVVEYRGIAIKVAIFSYVEEYNIHVEAKVRSVAVELNYLAALWCENELVGSREAPQKIEISREVIEKSHAARMALADALHNSEATAPGIKALLESKSQFLSQVDRWFRIEMAFWFGSMGEEGETRLNAAMLACFPTAEQRLSLAECDNKFKQLSDNKLLSFCGQGMQSVFSTVHGYINKLLQGRCPSIAGISESPFLADVKLRLSYFITFEEPESNTQASTTIIGVKALKKHFAINRHKMDTKAEMNLQDIKGLIMFKFLLSDAEEKVVTAMTSYVATSSTGAQVSVGGDEPTKKTGPKKAAESANKFAQGFFD